MRGEERRFIRAYVREADPNCWINRQRRRHLADRGQKDLLRRKRGADSPKPEGATGIKISGSDGKEKLEGRRRDPAEEEGWTQKTEAGKDGSALEVEGEKSHPKTTGNRTFKLKQHEPGTPGHGLHIGR